jgi:transposase
MFVKKGFKFRLDPTTSQEQLFAQSPIEEERAIGIDVGLKHFAVLAAGSDNKAAYVSNPRFFNQHLPRLRVLNRRLSKKEEIKQKLAQSQKTAKKIACPDQALQGGLCPQTINIDCQEPRHHLCRGTRHSKSS